MANRQKLDYNSEELTQNLKRSAGQGVDAFFPERSPTSGPKSQSWAKSEAQQPPNNGDRQSVDRPGKQPTESADRQIVKIPGNHEPMTPRHRENANPSMVETVRKAVKQVGKEAATHRFTIDEKRAIADIVYTYGRQGYRTSENEIARIAINWLVQDYQRNGPESVLEQVCKALRE